MEVLLVLQIIVVVAMIGVILLQRGGGDGLTGGSSPNAFMTGRAQANLFTRTTAILATIFLVNSLALAYIASHTDREGSVLDKVFSESAEGTNSLNENKSSTDNSDKKVAIEKEEELEAPLADMDESSKTETKSESKLEETDEKVIEEKDTSKSEAVETVKKAKEAKEAKEATQVTPKKISSDVQESTSKTGKIVKDITENTEDKTKN